METHRRGADGRESTDSIGVPLSRSDIIRLQSVSCHWLLQAAPPHRAAVSQVPSAGSGLISNRLRVPALTLAEPSATRGLPALLVKIAQSMMLVHPPDADKPENLIASIDAALATAKL